MRCVLLIATLVFFATGSFADESRAPASVPELDELLLEDDWLQPDPADRDPLECMNRNTHGMNEGILVWIVDPLHRAYRFVMPGPVRRSVVRFFSNLGEPAILANDLFQFAPLDASETGARFLINTTVGVAGFFDPAKSLGLAGHKTDFGETLAAYHAPSGPYFVVPILGPSTIRGAFGQAVDLVMRPDIWLLGLGSVVLVSTGSGMATYDIQKDRLEALRETSVDYYAALRGAYLLDRDARVEKRVCGLAWRSCEGEDVIEAAVGR
ncbi:MAG: VacJ family lipoprotein [Deltaproteobacteria bacterium]|nr:VacJ family lipoprotein [Deltaproteobacteria bacterium]